MTTPTDVQPGPAGSDVVTQPPTVRPFGKRERLVLPLSSLSLSFLSTHSFISENSFTLHPNPPTQTTFSHGQGAPRSLALSGLPPTCAPR